MLKRDITYEDADGDKVTETFYFNLTPAETVEFQVGFKGGLEDTIRRMVKAENPEELVFLVKKLILLSYGQRSEDGKHFFKSDELRDKFSQSFAYSSLFMELASNDDSAFAFIQGIFPKELTKNLNKTEVINLPVPTAKE